MLWNNLVHLFPDGGAAHACTRPSRFLTEDLCHLRPRGVSMPRTFRAAARLPRLVTPSWRMATTTGARLAAWVRALAMAACTPAALPLPARRKAAAPFGLQHRAARLGGLQRFAGPFGDGLALMLGDQSHNPDCQFVGVGHVGRHETHSAIAQGEQEGGVARQSVKFGNHQSRAGQARELQRVGQCRTVIGLAAFHLGERGYHLALYLFGIAADGCGLGLEAQAGVALLCGGDSVIGDRFCQLSRHGLDQARLPGMREPAGVG